MQRLVTALFNRWEGKPALVIGGGPSVLRDLPKLSHDNISLVISANEHGFKQDKFKVDLVTNVDKMHCLHKIPMEKILRPYGVPIVNRHSWADYRLPDWHFSGNTGMTAIALAALLGANPVIVTGIDMWYGGRIYFHDKGAKPTKDKRVRESVRRRDKMRVKPLVQFCVGARVQPMSGVLLEWFNPYEPGKSVKASRPVGYRLRLEEETTEVLCEVTRPFVMSSNDMTKLGQRLALSNFEFEKIGCDLRRIVDKA